MGCPFLRCRWLSTALGHKKGSTRVACAAFFPLTTVSVGTVLGVTKGSCLPKISEGLIRDESLDGDVASDVCTMPESSTVITGFCCSMASCCSSILETDAEETAVDVLLNLAYFSSNEVRTLRGVFSALDDRHNPLSSSSRLIISLKSASKLSGVWAIFASFNTFRAFLNGVGVRGDTLNNVLLIRGVRKGSSCVLVSNMPGVCRVVFAMLV